MAGHRRQGARQSPTLATSRLPLRLLLSSVYDFIVMATVCCHQGLNVVSRPLPPQPPTPPTAIFRMQIARCNIAAAKGHLRARCAAANPRLAACTSPPLARTCHLFVLCPIANVAPLALTLLPALPPMQPTNSPSVAAAASAPQFTKMRVDVLSSACHRLASHFISHRWSSRLEASGCCCCFL